MVLGRRWEPAQGTIVGVARASRRRHGELVYLVDVPLPTGGVQAQVAPTRSMGPDLPPGTQVRVEVNARTGEARFGANPVEDSSPGPIAVSADPSGADRPGSDRPGTDRPGSDTPDSDTPGSGNVTENPAESAAAALGDVAEIVRRLGGGQAGNAVAAMLTNLGSELTSDPEQTTRPARPEPPPAGDRPADDD